MSIVFSRDQTRMTLGLVEIGPMDVDFHGRFFDFAEQTFENASFRLWAARGGWDDRYSVFAVIDNGEIVSTVGRAAMRFVADGRTASGYQLGVVATRPDQRGRGHLRRLMEHVLSQPPLDNRTVMLFGNEQVTGFYPRFGFTRIPEWHHRLPVEAADHAAAPTRRLDMSLAADREILADACRTSVALSDDFCAADYYPILLWHLTYRPLQPIALSEPKAIVVVSRRDDVLVIHDVVSDTRFDLEPWLPQLAEGPVGAVEFGFNPVDWLGEEAQHRLEWQQSDPDSDPFFALGRPSPSGRVGRFPELART
jgi:predicted N-acetyltransferase YhbS